MASNYRAACRAKSPEDFAYKLSVVEEEADETGLWLELIIDHKMLPARRVQGLLAEADEISAIMVASQQTARGRRRAIPKSKIHHRQ